MSQPLDRLSALFERFRVRASLFHSGMLCGIQRFEPEAGRGFLHVLKNGEMTVSHPGTPGRIAVTGPSLLFYPRALAHVFHNAPVDGADFVCATLAFQGGDAHPVARALPPWVILPLADAPDLNGTLDLLFREREAGQCGQRLIVDRLFEVLLLQLVRWLLDRPDVSQVPVGLLRGLGHPAIARVLAAIHEQPGADWNLRDMADRAGMSRSTFAATFRQVIGQPPADYVAALRVMIAGQRLEAGHGLKQVADELGYASASSLSRAFANQVGQSPRAWRNRVKTEMS